MVPELEKKILQSQEKLTPLKNNKMAKTDKVEIKDQKIEKSSKNLKSSYSKKKEHENILNGITYVQSTFNNTIISIADTNGNDFLVICRSERF